MVGPTSSETCDGSPLTDRMASLARTVVVPWRSVVAVVLLSMLLGVLLSGNAHATLISDGFLAGESGEGHFGQSVALSADGNTALVGAPTGNSEAGAVWVFTRTGSTWTQQAELTPKSGEEIGNGKFGASVALSSDGNTVLIGAPANTGGGAVWVFTRSGSTWVQQGTKITGAEESVNSEFGRSVALSAEGDTAVVGAPSDGSEPGAVWVFTRSEEAEGVWSQQGLKIIPEIGEEIGNDQFGASVAVSAEGNTTAVGAPTDNSNVGAVWAFTRTGSIWTQQGVKITGAEEIEEGHFGASVALGAEGNTALMGGPGDSKETGAVWAFTRSSEGIWAQQGGKLIAKTGEESEKGAFGASVALSSEGNTALMGGPGDSEGIGAAWTFTRSSEGVWAQQGGKLTGGEEESGEGHFGASVALSSDGYTEFVGGPGNSSGAGAAWAFVNPPTVSNVNPSKGPEAGGTLVTITGTNFNEATAVTFGSNNATSFEVISPTSITAVSPAGMGNPDISVTTSGGTSATISADKFSYVPAPAVAKVSPDKGPEAGGTSVTITGENLGEATAVRFGSSSATSFEVISATSITAVSPAGTTGAVDVTVSTPGGESAISTADKFSYVALPTVAKVSPDKGPTAGGTSVTITGTDLSEATAVEFGSVSATSFKVISATSVTAVVPAGTGTVDVTVSTAGGASATSSADQFSYVPPPTVTNVNPNAGPTAGGTSVIITGTNLGEATAVKFGSNGATGVEVHSATSITAFAPAGSGTVHVTVSTPGGMSAAGEANEFSYVPLPTVTKVSPTKGPEAGGTSVTITGTNLSEATAVRFGSASATGVTVNSATSITAVSPTAAGTVDVTVSSAGGTSATSAGDEFSYVALPTVAKVSPNEGPLIGGTGVTITGTNFNETTAVKFGSKSATSFKLVSETSITAVAPVGTGTVNVTVSTPGGESAISTADQFSYVPAPTVVTKAASSVAQTAATLNATVNPNGSEVSDCHFEYGTSKTYGKSVPCSSLPGSGSSPVAVSAAAVGLSANTTYHFRVVAENTGGPSSGADQTFTTLPEPPMVVTEAASSITQTAATVNATVNPNGGSVSDCHFEYGTSKSYGKSMPCLSLPGSGTGPVGVSASVGSLTPNTVYHFRIVATNPGGKSEGADQTFKTLPEPPTVVTEAASSIAKTAATLNATVNPNGGEVGVGECKLEYGITKSYGKSVPCSSLPGSGTSPVGVSASVTGLSANTTYHFRIVATNPGGTSEGADQTFKTLPDAPMVVTKAASSLTQTGVTLNATVNPNEGTVTDCHFEYGPTMSYGTSVPCTPSSPGSGNSPVAVSAAVVGLSPNTTYHFRIVATNPGGTSKGADQTLKTLPNPPTGVTGKASLPTQTSVKLNATVNPNGGEVTSCDFEYGISESYGSNAPCTSSPGSGASAVEVSASVASLIKNTTYHFRIIVTNPGGTSHGADQTLSLIHI